MADVLYLFSLFIYIIVLLDNSNMQHSDSCQAIGQIVTQENLPIYMTEITKLNLWQVTGFWPYVIQGCYTFIIFLVIFIVLKDIS